MRLLLLLALVLSANTSSADIHQWRDAQGNLHFGDQPPEHVRSQRVEVRPNLYTAQDAETPPPAGDSQANPAVTLYSTTWCGYCKKARDYFRSNNVRFKEYDVETSRKGQQDYARFGANGVPIIIVGERRLQGFSAAQFDRAYAQK